MDNLKFRRQFILADRRMCVDVDWKVFKVNSGGKDWFFNYHPDLDFLVKRNDRHCLVLIGYILDPLNPDYDNDEILSVCLAKKDLNEILCQSNQYTGRYVIVYFNEKTNCLFHDATGFREVYYTVNGTCMACGSTSNLLSTQLNLPMTKDPEINTFYHSQKFNKHDNTWIGFKTLFKDILHLSPNHYLDLDSRKVTRYWPSECLDNINIDSGADECIQILKGTFSSAAKRFKLHMGITAGWDTRLLLAASREFKNSIFYYVNKSSALSFFNKDIRIPKLLSRKLGFKLNVLDIPENVPAKFKKQLFENNVLANDKLLPVFYNVYVKKWENTHTISGAMGNGLARIYMPFPKGVEVSGKNIARLNAYENFPYVVKELDKWCLDVIPICEKYHINILDIYQWEQENSHWATLTSSEQDIVREEIRPFNNRRLIEIFWSLENKERYQYYPEIYVKIMEKLWKEVLDYPFNPSLKSGIFKFLRLFRMERKAYYYYKKQKYFGFIEKPALRNI